MDHIYEGERANEAIRWKGGEVGAEEERLLLDEEGKKRLVRERRCDELRGREEWAASFDDIIILAIASLGFLQLNILLWCEETLGPPAATRKHSKLNYLDASEPHAKLEYLLQFD
ncbi:hypothetical protein ACH5RR_023246 [Cinchona calisaya]|uniref:Uncharacterized protein n=1 Tax=Cinchona calisaya TaxID=153742 RepID=A0ABD2ZA40_9GENT